MQAHRIAAPTRGSHAPCRAHAPSPAPASQQLHALLQRRCVRASAGASSSSGSSNTHDSKKAGDVSKSPQPQRQTSGDYPSPSKAGLAAANAAESLNLAFESDAAASSKKQAEAAAVSAAAAAAGNNGGSGVSIMESPVKTTGLHRAPLSGGVKTATSRYGSGTGSNSLRPTPAPGPGPTPALPRSYDLPSPSVAVRNLVEHARFGHLCTVMSGMHHRRAGYPFGTLVDFASDGAGYPVFCLSPLAIHSRNLIEEPRCSLVVQMPGWTGLANARVTIFGDVYQLPADLQDAAREIFINKHSNERKERWVSGNFVYFRMNRITDIYFVGGFGTVQWIAPDEYLASTPDDIVLNNPNHILQVLNERFAPDLRTKLSCGAPRPLDELLFISIDATGVDIRVRTGQEFSVERIGFGQKVTDLQQVVSAMQQVVADVTRASQCGDDMA